MEIYWVIFYGEPPPKNRPPGSPGPRTNLGPEHYFNSMSGPRTSLYHKNL